LAPSALIAVLAAVVAVTLLGLGDRGVRVLGEVETGMLALSVPALSMQQVVALVPGAMAIVLLGYSVSLSVANVGAQKTGEQVDPNQELVGLGIGNLGSAFSSGFVVCGSLSRGVVIMGAGGRSQIVSLINAGLVILTLVVALPLFFSLPYATLSAIVITAMSGLLSVTYFRRLLHLSHGEFAYGIAALFGVLVLGILPGVALGVVLSLVVLIRRVSRPVTAVLGRVPGTDSYRDLIAHPEAEAISGLLIFRFDAPIIFPNAGYFADEVRRHIAEASTPIREVLLPAQQINEIDSTGAHQLAALKAELSAKGITLSLAEAKSALQAAIRRSGFGEEIGIHEFDESIHDGVQRFVKGQQEPRKEETS
jgi:MFS superfamily sulfate permease-like transporter